MTAVTQKYYRVVEKYDYAFWKTQKYIYISYPVRIQTCISTS